MGQLGRLSGIQLESIDGHFYCCGISSAWGTEEEPEGIVGLEVFNTVALLRSLAVTSSRRGAGLGLRAGLSHQRKAQGDSSHFKK
ncbi:MAG: hypothetical protein ACWGNO_18065 [Desulfobacterales bacterium]